MHPADEASLGGHQGTSQSGALQHLSDRGRDLASGVRIIQESIVHGSDLFLVCGYGKSGVRDVDERKRRSITRA
jgi:hypothetical protein